MFLPILKTIVVQAPMHRCECWYDEILQWKHLTTEELALILLFRWTLTDNMSSKGLNYLNRLLPFLPREYDYLGSMDDLVVYALEEPTIIECNLVPAFVNLEDARTIFKSRSHVTDWVYLYQLETCQLNYLFDIYGVMISEQFKRLVTLKPFKVFIPKCIAMESYSAKILSQDIYLAGLQKPLSSYFVGQFRV